MSELFLIAHKVRGEAAFDVAEKLGCPLCHELGCHECDDLGYWWIIPTSGHRAYPWWSMELYEFSFKEGLPIEFYNMPPDCPDHYPHKAEPSQSRLTALLAALPPAVVKPFKRRF